MRKIILYALLLFVTTSCKKSKTTQTTCDSSLIGTQWYTPTSTPNYVSVVIVNANNGAVTKSYQTDIQVYQSAIGIYDHIHNNYYLYGYTNDTTVTLFCVNTVTGATHKWYPQFSIYPVANMACNSTTGKLYFFAQNNTNSGYEIYEATPDTSGNLNERLVFESNIATVIFSAAIDESTGYIYYSYDSTSSPLNVLLAKVNPASGSFSSVAQYTDILPSGLSYNYDDSMLYGLNTRLTNPSLIKIDPATGNITEISSTNIDRNDIVSVTFDYCSNQLVIFDIQNLWLNPANGNVVKLFTYLSPSNVGVY